MVVLNNALNLKSDSVITALSSLFFTPVITVDLTDLSMVLCTANVILAMKVKTEKCSFELG